MTGPDDRCYGVTAMREPVPPPGRAASDQADGVNQGLTVLSYLIAGVLVWGGAGWALDRVLDTEFLLPVGIVLGAAAGVYLVIARFGQLGPAATAREAQTERKGAPWA